MSQLTKEQIDFYCKEGYLLPKQQLFARDDFAELTEIFENLLLSNTDIRSDQLDTPHFNNDQLFKFLLHNKVLDLVESLIGPNIGLFSSHFISKEPKTGRMTPWHEDSAYWEGRFDKYDKIITIWLAIDDVDVENGCMGVVPGSHKNGFSEYEEADTSDYSFDKKIRQDQIDIDKVVWFELENGTYSLHDSRMIHGANANLSDRRRCGYTMRYFSLEMKYNHELDGDFKIYHARGENIAGNKLKYL